MPAIHIVTDSACDLAPELAEDRGVKVVPLSIRFGSEQLADRTELSTKEFWDRVTTGSVMPQTAAPSPGAFEEAFLGAAGDGAEGVVCVCLSSKLSATYEVARSAAAAVADRIPVCVFDSLAVSVAQGMLVVAAWQAAGDGAGLDEIEAELAGKLSRTKIYGTIDSLDFLRRGGRMGGAAALVGSMLSIKPVVEVRGGTVELESRQRTRSRALAYLTSKVSNAGDVSWVGVMSGAAADAGELVAMVREAVPGCEPVVVELGPVVGSHTGPGTLGLAFETTSRP